MRKNNVTATNEDTGFTFFFTSCLQKLVGGRIVISDDKLICTRVETAELLSHRNVPQIELEIEPYFKDFRSGTGLIDVTRKAAEEVRKARRNQLLLYVQSIGSASQTSQKAVF